MYNATLEKKTAQTVAKMVTGSTFDITLLDSYFLENEVEVDLVFSLYNYIYKTEWANTFIFTNSFEIEFSKIVDIFICLHSHSFRGHSDSYTIDVMNLQNPIFFKDTFVQNIFRKWLKWEC